MTVWIWIDIVHVNCILHVRAYSKFLIGLNLLNLNSYWCHCTTKEWSIYTHKNILLTRKWCQWRSKVQQYQGHKNVWMVNIETNISRLKNILKLSTKQWHIPILRWLEKDIFSFDLLLFSTKLISGISGFHCFIGFKISILERLENPDFPEMRRETGSCCCVFGVWRWLICIVFLLKLKIFWCKFKSLILMWLNECTVLISVERQHPIFPLSSQFSCSTLLQAHLYWL